MQIILSVTIEGIAIFYFEIAINGILQYAEKSLWTFFSLQSCLKICCKKNSSFKNEHKFLKILWNVYCKNIDENYLTAHIIIKLNYFQDIKKNWIHLSLKEPPHSCASLTCVNNSFGFWQWFLFCIPYLYKKLYNLCRLEIKLNKLNLKYSPSIYIVLNDSVTAVKLSVRRLSSKSLEFLFPL